MLIRNKPDVSWFVNMKQNNTEPYQVCFLSTYDNVIKDKDRIKRDTVISGEINLWYIHKFNYKIRRV
jgi:hypothetical protein